MLIQIKIPTKILIGIILSIFASPIWRGRVPALAGKPGEVSAPSLLHHLLPHLQAELFAEHNPILFPAYYNHKPNDEQQEVFQPNYHGYDQLHLSTPMYLNAKDFRELDRHGKYCRRN